MFVLTGILLGSLVVSTHESREACEGRRVLLIEKGVWGSECKMTTGVVSSGTSFGGYSGSIKIAP